VNSSHAFLKDYELKTFHFDLALTLVEICPNPNLEMK
jgi:hypothetical protein